MAVRIPRSEAELWLVPMIRHWRETRTPSGQALIVGISAGSGAGKGHLVDAFLRVFGRSACAMGLDAYYRGDAWMKAHGVTSYDIPEVLEDERAAEDIDALRRRETVQMPIYDFPSGKRQGYRPFPSADIVIVEGLFALRPPVLERLDFKIYIETDAHSALLRRLFRDAGPNGRTRQSSREIVAQYFRQVLPAKRRYIDVSACQADAIVESRYRADEEAEHAGAREHQLKRRCDGALPPDEKFRLAAARKTAGWQTDHFLVPRDRSIDGEMIRLRQEDGGHWSFTYKGPLLAGDGVRVRDTHETEIAEEDARRFEEEYRGIAVVRKHRILYAFPDGEIAFDRVEGLGDFIEIRAASAERVVALDIELRLKLGDIASAMGPTILESYLDLHLKSKKAAS